jgi:aryl-alcohol dehydrogenase-like predicted oxidoreductase
MEITRTAYGMWNGGRFMHYGKPLDDEHLLGAVRHAWERGIRTFLTADVYGNGAADEMLGRALSGFPRDSYCLVGAIGHDFYKGQRQGAKGYPRFTDPSLRAPREFGAYLRMATEKSLERCQADHFDCLLLHNPDATGYGDDAVWRGMEKLRENGLTRVLGIAPGPANGFTLDVILNFERFGALIDWAMIILNPLEPWPGSLCLPAAEKFGVNILTRVVDYGGLFHDDVKPGHEFGKQDHRAFRPAGWVEAGYAKIEKLRPFAERHGVTLLQLACIWNLSHTPVRSVVPTLIQEIGAGAKSIEEKIDELASLPELELSDDEREEIRLIGDNTGCMELKGANPAHSGETLPDRWSISNDLSHVAHRWRIEPARDLACTHTASAAS